MHWVVIFLICVATNALSHFKILILLRKFPIVLHAQLSAKHAEFLKLLRKKGVAQGLLHTLLAAHNVLEQRDQHDTLHQAMDKVLNELDDNEGSLKAKVSVLVEITRCTRTRVCA